MNKEEREFHFEEYKQLKIEILEVKRQAENMFKYSVVIAALVLTWLTTNTVDSSYVKIVWWIPTVTTVCCGLLGFMYYMRVRTFGEYIQKLEAELGHNELGWEKFLPTKKPIFKITYGLSWFLLLFFCLFVAMTSVQTVSEQDSHNKSIHPTANASAD